MTSFLSQKGKTVQKKTLLLLEQEKSGVKKTESAAHFTEGNDIKI